MAADPEASGTFAVFAAADPCSGSSGRSTGSVPGTHDTMPPPGVSRSNQHESRELSYADSMGSHTSADAAASVASVAYSAAPNPDFGDLGDWRAVVDESSGTTYYYNIHTQQTAWELPDSAFGASAQGSIPAELSQALASADSPFPE
eukprot:3365646-Pleurochrysis_carterae.AAC.2